MAGDCAAFSATLAANGAVLPLARLLLRSAHRPSAACTAAWALSNLLWGAPGQVRQHFCQGTYPMHAHHPCCSFCHGQAGQLLDVPGFRDGLTAALGSADLREEAAWLLAFVCAGPEAHMHAMVKHGAAAAAAAALCEEVEVAGGALAPLLRCLGNMAPSRAAAEVLCRDDCTAAIMRCASNASWPGLQGEAQWVLANLRTT